MKYDFLVVGAGFAGSVVAEQLARAGKTVRLVDKKPHIGGNAYDEYDEHGVLVHLYGPHVFHTNSKRIFEYLSQFTTWRFYEHRALSSVRDKLLPIPINRTTINRLYGLSLSESGVADFIEKARQPRATLKTSEDVVLNSVGPELCDLFFRGYTRKQWGLDLSQLSASVAARIPVRTNDDDRYFTDSFQFMPADGYSKMFERMLSHPHIDISLGIDFEEARATCAHDAIVYTGPVDAFFDYRFGKLPYRSLRFEHWHLPDKQRYQAVGQVNYPNDFDYTRSTEYRYLTGQEHEGTTIVREYPQADGDPYYPIPHPENKTLFKRYEELCKREKNVAFVGRLAQYRYYNMDQVVGAALTTAKNILGQV